MTEGRTIIPKINELLALPFDVKVATKDFHPKDHISFASNHPAPNNKPFESTYRIVNPYNSNENELVRLWPDHCIQGTPGAELVPELDKARIHHVIEKGMDKRVEMYSAFSDPFRSPPVSKSRLADLLKKAGISHVFLVGLAADYCVKYTAMDSCEENFTTYIVEDATKAVDSHYWPTVRGRLHRKGVHLIDSDSEEIKLIRESS